ncbi:MAG: 4-amino-4-deoxy-L-arabinose transferase-like glycosyltransferase [Saprospiraceae bacterium]|jgi:4-amino-4-deoxy-L-arabinose transferase-like glycosyltransferase
MVYSKDMAKQTKLKMQQVLTNRNLQLTFIGIVLFIFFLGNNQLVLWDNAESAVALMAQQIVESGDWGILFFNFSDGILTHPLQVWETAISYYVFGVNEFATRFPSIIYIILTFAALFYFVRRLYSETLALLAIVILASSFLVPTLAKVSLAESGLLFYATVMFFGFWSSLKGADLKITIAFWAAILLSTFQGGFVAAFAMAGSWVILFALKKNLRSQLLQLKPWLFPIVLIPIIAWAFITNTDASIIQRTPFYDTFLNPSTSVSFGQQTIILLLGFLPWLAFLPSSIFRLVKDFIKQEEEAIFYGSWIFLGYLIYEFVPSAMYVPSVIIYPAIAVLMGKQFLDFEAACERFEDAPINEHLEIRVKKAGFHQENLTKTTQLLGVIVIFGIIFGLAMFGYSQGVGILKTSFVGMLLWMAGFGTAIGLYARNSQITFYSTISGGLLFMLFGWLLVVPVMEPARSIAERTGGIIEKIEVENQVILSVSDQYALASLPFYLNNKSIEYQVFTDVKELETLYLSSEKMIFVLDDYQYKALKETVNAKEHKADKIIPVEGILKGFRGGNYWIVKR